MARVKLCKLKAGDEFTLGENLYRVRVRYTDDEEQIAVINLDSGRRWKFPRNLIVNLIERRKE